jgi:hypothetical protein
MSYLPLLTVIVEWETSRECGHARAAACLTALREQLQDTVPLFEEKPELLLVTDPGEDERADVERAVANAAGASGWPVFPRVVQPPTRLDYYQKKNFGASVSSNPIVVFIDSDVRPEQGWLAALLKPFRDPGVSVVAGSTHSEAGTLYEQAVGLFWIFPARSDEDVLRPATHFWANSFAMRRPLFLATGFPDRSTYRGQCSALRRRLEGLGVRIYEATAARTSHPAPRGPLALTLRAWRAGADARFEDGLAGTGGPRRCCDAWIDGMRRVEQRIAERSAAIGSDAAARAAGRLLGFFYYSVRAFGYLWAGRTDN